MNEAASSVEPEVKTHFATVDDAAIEKLLYEKMLPRIWKMPRKLIKTIFTTKLHLECVI